MTFTAILKNIPLFSLEEECVYQVVMEMTSLEPRYKDTATNTDRNGEEYILEYTKEKKINS